MGDYSELKRLLDACLAQNCDGPREFSKACEALFDVCSIETIAGLVAEIERLRTAEGDAMTYKAGMENVAQQRDQLKAENERLRKLPTCWSEVLEQSEANDELLDKVLELGADAERYRFLCDKFGETKLPCALERILAGDLYVADGKPSIDSAIDAAMGKREQS